MRPTLSEGDLVIGQKTKDFSYGDVVAMTYEGRVMVKRVIGCPGDEIDIRDDGKLLRNGAEVTIPEAMPTARGSADFEYPITIPEGEYFLLGDNREVSVDSRGVIGLVGRDQLMTKITLRVWPIASIGAVK